MTLYTLFSDAKYVFFETSGAPGKIALPPDAVTVTELAVNIVV